MVGHKVGKYSMMFLPRKKYIRHFFPLCNFPCCLVLLSYVIAESPKELLLLSLTEYTSPFFFRDFSPLSLFKIPKSLWMMRFSKAKKSFKYED